MLEETKFIEIRLSGSPPGDRCVFWHQQDREGIIQFATTCPTCLWMVCLAR